MKLFIILIIVLITAIALLGVTIMNNQNIQISNLIEKSRLYTYNSICDIQDVEKFMIEKVWVTTMEITNGKHNDNPKVSNFFKTNKLLSTLDVTPHEILTSQENATGQLALNYDPIFYDVTFWMPLALEILDVSPEVIQILSIHENEDNTAYTTRTVSEINRCK